MSGIASGEATLDPSAKFSAVVEDHRGLLWRIAASYEADADLRQDLYQDILVAVWRALPQFRGTASLKTYLARIAHNRGVDHVARAVRRPRTVPLEDAAPAVSGAPSPSEAAVAADERARLQSAVQTLPLSARQVVTLTLEDFTPREIAGVLGVPVNAVSIRLTRAKAALRAALEEAAP